MNHNIAEVMLRMVAAAAVILFCVFPFTSPKDQSDHETSVSLQQQEEVEAPVEEVPVEEVADVEEEVQEEVVEQEAKPEKFVPEVRFYSADWCTYCPRQERILKDAGIKYKLCKLNSMEGGFPQVWISQPNGRWKRWKGVVSAHSIQTEIARLSGDKIEPFRRQKKESYNLADLQRMNSSQLRDVIASHSEWLPSEGTVVGITVTQHLTQDHGFSQQQIAGLSEAERHKLHQIAHNMTDGRTTATQKQKTYNSYRYRMKRMRRRR